jgi:hypothetical protein
MNILALNHFCGDVVEGQSDGKAVIYVIYRPFPGRRKK